MRGRATLTRPSFGLYLQAFGMVQFHTSAPVQVSLLPFLPWTEHVAGRGPLRRYLSDVEMYSK